MAGLAEQKNKTGQIFIEGKILDDKNLYDLRENIGFVFQDPNDQLFSTTIFDDVAFGLINFLNKNKDPKGKDRQFIETRVKESLARVNPVSYTHLDVYKRQLQIGPSCIY